MDPFSSPDNVSKQHNQAATMIQKYVRGWLLRSKHKTFVSNIKHRKYIINEILSNERSYVKKLATIINVLYKPMLEKEVRQVVEREKVLQIFSNIEELYCVHNNLHRELARSPHKLGTAFLKTVPTFRLYRTYFANYSTSKAVVSDLLSNNEPFAEFIQECFRQHPDSKPPDLLSLLSLPTLQLCRYKLLLEDLLMHTNPQNEDYASLSESLKALTDVIAAVESARKPYQREEIAEASPPSSTQKSSEKTRLYNHTTPSTAHTPTHSTHATFRTSSGKKPARITPQSTPRRAQSLISSPSPSRSPSTTFDSDSASTPSYLRPTQASYAYASAGRAKRDQVAYTNSNTPLWMPSGDAHEEKIYKTVYNAIPFTPRQSTLFDRSSGPKWFPPCSTPRSFDSLSPSRSPSRSSSRQASPRNSPLTTPTSSHTPPHPFGNTHSSNQKHQETTNNVQEATSNGKQETSNNNQQEIPNDNQEQQTTGTTTTTTATSHKKLLSPKSPLDPPKKNHLSHQTT